MKYRLHENISVEEICGNYLLVASGDAKDKLNYARGLNEVGAEIIRKVQKRKNTDEIIQELADEYEMPEEEIRSGIVRFIKEMESQGYLIKIKGDEK